MKSALIILTLTLQLSLNAQVDKPNVFYKERYSVVKETLSSMVDIQHDGWFGYVEDKEIHAFWTDNAVLYFGRDIRAQQFSFFKVSFKSQEYFIFSKTELDSTKSDSILDSYQKIKDFPSSRYIDNWKPTVDGGTLQIETMNNKVDYQLRTFTGIQSNLENCPEAKYLNDFFELARRLISKNIRNQIPVSYYSEYYRDHSVGRLVPILTKNQFKSLKKRADLKIRKLPPTTPKKTWGTNR